MIGRLSPLKPHKACKCACHEQASIHDWQITVLQISALIACVIPALLSHLCETRQGCLQAAEDVVSAVRQGGCPAVAVVGSKGVGKSTLSRLLVNSLLEATPVVAYLDTDCGQSEFTVPGQNQHLLGLHCCQTHPSAFLQFKWIHRPFF